VAANPVQQEYGHIHTIIKKMVHLIFCFSVERRLEGEVIERPSFYLLQICLGYIIEKGHGHLCLIVRK
jgi:hypothetical protein